MGLSVYWQVIVTKFVTSSAALIFSFAQEMPTLYGNWMFNFSWSEFDVGPSQAGSNQFTLSLSVPLLSILLASFYILLHFTRIPLVSGFGAKVYQLRHRVFYVTQQINFSSFVYTNSSKQWEKTELFIISTCTNTGRKTRPQGLYFGFLSSFLIGIAEI
jgi:hypothetical protein